MNYIKKTGYQQSSYDTVEPELFRLGLVKLDHIKFVMRLIKGMQNSVESELGQIKLCDVEEGMQNSVEPEFKNPSIASKFIYVCTFLAT